MTRTKAALPNLTLPEIHAALSYYYAHKAHKAHKAEPFVGGRRVTG